jgi:hypothetical protein
MGDLGVTMGVKIGGMVTPLSAVRPCEWALDMFGSLDLTIGSLISRCKGDE